MKKAYILGVLVVLGLFFYFLTKDKPLPGLQAPTPTSKPIDYVASFEITTLGTKRTFDDPRYHDLTDYLYLSALDPSFVHVKKSGLTWSDFFATLPMKLTSECLTTGTGQVFCTNETKKLRFTLNNREDPNALEKEISPGAKLLVTYE